MFASSSSSGYHLASLHRPSRVIFFSISCLLLLIATESKISCETSEFCETTLRQGSKCVNGYCDNPFQYGCLKSRPPDSFTQNRKHVDSSFPGRVCNSEDPADAADRGLCRTPSEHMNYPEVRIMGQNWESPFFQVSIASCVVFIHNENP